MKTVFAAAFLVAMVLAANRATPQPPRPALPDERLAFLVGEWRTTNRMYENGHTTESVGTARYRWDLDNTWLVFESRIGGEKSGHYEVRGGVARLPAGGYRAFAYNSLGFLIVYEGAWEGDTRLVFTALGTEAGKGSRVAYEKLATGGVRLLSQRQLPDGSYFTYFEAALHNGAGP